MVCKYSILDEFILYYVITAENKFAGKLNTNAWARRDEDGRLEKWYYYTEREGEWQDRRWRTFTKKRRQSWRRING
jgi:hypothetical protein